MEAKIERAGEIVSTGNAVNEAVIHPAKIAHMIDFHVYINDKFAFSQRSDGLIVSTLQDLRLILFRWWPDFDPKP